MDDRIFDPELGEEEVKREILLRPENFSEYIGQTKIVQNIDVMVESARMRGQSMDHVLLSGPPGLGKTSLAMIISKALGSELHVISGPAIEKKGDLAAILTNLEARDVLFIDEIHRMHISVEEILYSAMEDYRLDIVIGEGAAARTMQIDIAPFTLIGATTRSGLLSNPLRDRFMAHLHFDFYADEELAKIIENNAKKLSLSIEEQARLKMAKCSRGTPRIANRILRRVRDFAVVRNSNTVTMDDVDHSLDMMEIDPNGLDRMDRKILSVIADYYNGGPVGVEALCATLGEDRNTIEDVYEPYLLKEGFLIRTPRGREISDKSRKALGMEIDNLQGSLFNE
ncbi:Holliday junction branch migration DNA helicase RuvB [Bacteriovorax sp. DB6_IX]|uniref:Holliday junction branch migration DNA helicase RuvB n=1 Tax=Bacteriovorax sp. DB6_IX TaxID=1353530 RepID=UPI00038A51BA|nr:Holliday junction branch migration DNA helicase RuvB [Bacteriovorax sp. DB6_IX]EQC51429.1 Holliday junction DNA helicase RuvB [Bacteriovorax sp. DB6_IX]